MSALPAVPDVAVASSPTTLLIDALRDNFADRGRIALACNAFRSAGGVPTAAIVPKALASVLSSCHGVVLRDLRARDVWMSTFARDVLMQFSHSYERENLLSVLVPYVHDPENFEDVVVSSAVPDLNQLRMRDLRRTIQYFCCPDDKGAAAAGGSATRSSHRGS